MAKVTMEKLCYVLVWDYIYTHTCLNMIISLTIYFIISIVCITIVLYLNFMMSFNCLLFMFMHVYVFDSFCAV